MKNNILQVSSPQGHRITGTLMLFLFFCCSPNLIAQENTGMDKMWGCEKMNTTTSLSDKTDLFSKGNYGMFVHWGLFSRLEGQWNDSTYYGIGEWIMNSNMAGIPPETYMKLAKDYNPSSFDAGSIARLAKEAGMKYIIITAKHHEGFAMFKSNANSFNIVDATPFARDPMKELSEACRAEGLGFGFYYSHNQDWTAPGGSGGPKIFPDGSPASFKDYFYSKCLPQVKEICTNYGPLDFIWFDTPGNMDKKLVFELADVVRKLQPNAMLCSRIGYGLGDYISKGDMMIPAKNIDGLWETCDTNNDSWGYVRYDQNFKDTKEIIFRLVSTVSRGGTYLFNVGPSKTGEIPETGTCYLKKAGEWIHKYPQVIYDAESSPWGHSLAWGDVTTHVNTLSLVVFEWPQDGKLYLHGLNDRIVSMKLLSGNKKESIKFQKQGEWTVLNVPCQKPDYPASVIEVQMDKPAKEIVVDTDLNIYPNIGSTLLADFAEVKGVKVAEKKWMEKFGEWKHLVQLSEWENNATATWTVNVFEPGYYHVDLRYSGEKRLVWRIATDEDVFIRNQQPATEKYQDYPIGIIRFNTPGKHKISVSLINGNRKTGSLTAVKISPAK